MGSLDFAAASGIEWGAVSGWFSGAATTVAVIVALTFSLRSERMQRNTQYASVHAWVELTPGPGRTGTLWLTNHTEYPIYEWAITVSWTDEKGAEAQAETGSAEHGLLPPGRHSFTFDGAHLVLPSNDALVRVRLEFRDAQGRRLRRLPSGKLEKF
ncbi:hypothetical protein AGRA3207_002091 [Actinomadura graeca]|uniref:Uncharacterized protein n=1 Tax=Actinomadura graeca TaxID=2750812 RepID=A0ABX8QR33_9ACTN|nr:hypothetical protein [Actinomadura graeca]QXJ21254.1 hypothetical protein AGRA3207_002091 [Actinomadura graeca]